MLKIPAAHLVNVGLKVVTCSFLLGWGGCSGEIDSEDELGTPNQVAEEYELILVDGDQKVDVEKDEGSKNKEVEREASADLRAVESISNPTDIDQAIAAVIYHPEGQFTVQIGVYSDAKVAGKLVQQLSKDGFPAYAIENPNKKGVRVRIGYFSTQDDAKRFGELMKKDRNWEFWVDKRANESY
jgi:cell division septation protein DedD